jgi:iron complex outermembrane receptor protein
MNKARFTLATAMAIALCPSAAFAQETHPTAAATDDRQPGALQDIVVTARKRKERLQDVPIAISAVSGADIARNGTLNTVSLSGSLPSLYIKQNPTTTVSSSIYIRGVGQEDSQFTQEPGVATYIDGIYYSRSSGSIMELVDIERIEVLRGPQGTLFGRNSPAGAISIVTKAPDLHEVSAKLEATVGNYDQRAIRGSGNVVLVDGVLAAKLDFMSRTEDGYMKNVSPTVTGGGIGAQELNSVDKQAGRLSLLFTPDNRLTMRLTADMQRDRSSAYAPAYAVANQDGSISYPTGGPFVTSIEPQFALPAVFDGYGLALTTDYKLNDAFTAKLITGYRMFHHFLAGDLVGIPGVSVGLQRDQRSYMFQQEAQLNYAITNFKVVGGLIYFRDLTKENAWNDFAAGVNDGSNLYPVSHQTTNSYAAYAEGTYEPLPYLSLTAGGRYSEDDKHMIRETTNLPNLTGPIIGYNVNESVNFRKFTPRVIVSFKPLKAMADADSAVFSDLLIYGSWSKGYKSGVFDPAYTLGQVGASSILSPEETTNYEGGFKSDLFRNHARFNVTYFNLKYANLQTLDCQFASNVCSGITQDVRLQGVEFEGQANLFSGFSLNFSAATLDSKYLKPTTSIRLQNTPKFTYSLGADYRVSLGSPGSLEFGADWRHTSDFYAVTRSAPETTIRSYGLLNGFIAYYPSDRWFLKLSGDNIANKFYIANIVDAGVGAAGHFIGRPREVKFTVGISM